MDPLLKLPISLLGLVSKTWYICGTDEVIGVGLGVLLPSVSGGVAISGPSIKSVSVVSGTSS